ncbi:hypothetical protein HDU76_003311, partial [Blyttiomyces sp. JEL0837]
MPASNSISNLPIFKCTNANIIRITSTSRTQAFNPITWTLSPNQSWAILGRVGAGKTTFGQALTDGSETSGTSTIHRFDPITSASWPLIHHQNLSVSQAVRMVTFKESSHMFSYAAHTVQDRYHSRQDPDEVVAGEYLLDQKWAPKR